MNGVTLSMAGEYAYAGIRVNAIVLGLINNGGSVAAILADEAMSAAVRARIPLPFVGEPDDIAWGAVFLLGSGSLCNGGAVADRRRRIRNDGDAGTQRIRVGTAQELIPVSL